MFPTVNQNYAQGFSLKIGSNCQEYVYCANGEVSSTADCPEGTLYTGDMGRAGICGWANVVQCLDTSGPATNTSIDSKGNASKLASNLQVTINMEENFDHSVDCSMGDWGLCHTQTLMLDYLGEEDWLDR